VTTRVLLVGLMATGKTTVGEAIAGVTGWPCLDNDALLQRSTGMTAPELLAQHGEQRLRSAESDVLTLLLSMPGPFVAGVAAGCVLDERNRDRLRTGGHVVWLRATLPTLVRRVSKLGGRAWVGADPETVLREMASERDPLYAEVATQQLDMDALTPVQAARAVVSALARE
jgi:shikimate kinase